MTAVLARADRLLQDAARVEPERAGMATTAAVLVLADDRGRVLVGNVGDSSVSRLGPDGLRAVSVSDRGTGHAIRQSLGGRGHPGPTPHVDALEMGVGDRLLLATDGLTDVIGAEAIEATLRDERREPAARLLRMVEAAGAPDDVALVVADVVDGAPSDGAAQSRGRDSNP